MGLLKAASKLTVFTIRNAPMAILTGAAGWIGYTAFRSRDVPPLPQPFPSDMKMIYTLEAGTVATHRSNPTSTDSVPVVLIHSVNAAASAFEMKPIFDRVGLERETVAIDLPGFGHSERADREYNAEMMADAIAEVLDKLGRPAHVVALSLGSEFAARAAAIRPDLVESLTLMSPTGMGRSSKTADTSPSPLTMPLDNSLIARSIYDLLVTRRSIEYFLDKSFKGEVDPGLVNQAILNGRQEDAFHAPAAFLQGKLFTSGAMNRLYQPLTVPTLVLYDEDAYTDFADLAEFVASGPGNRRAKRIHDTRGLPQFEQPDATIDALHDFWKDVEAG